MSEERLQEIKDSVEFQKEILKAHNMDTLCVDEEQELVEEIERLNNIIKNQQEDIEEYNDKLNEVVKERNKYLHIINELEKGIKENIEELEEHQLSRDRIDEDKEILRFLQELKGSDSNE